MRVIGGLWRGRVIAAPPGRETRPTSDRVREAVFSSVYSLLGPIDGVRAVDLYAGSGAMGIEALSRGAAHVTFVDDHRGACSVITRNLSGLGADEASLRVVCTDAARSSALLAGYGASLLFADPPYRIDASQVCKVLESHGRSGSLRTGALVVYEHAGQEFQWPRGFIGVSMKRYGDTSVSFARYEG